MPPRTASPNLCQFRLSTQERATLDASGIRHGDPSRTATITRLIAQEHQRRTSKRPKPLPPPEPHPIPPTGRATPHTVCKLTPETLAQLDTILEHMRNTEGIDTARNGVIRRIIHDETRRLAQSQ